MILARFILKLKLILTFTDKIKRSHPQKQREMESYFISFLLSTLLYLLHHTVLHCTGCKTRMWANAQRDGRPAEYRWRPLFNATKFG